MTSCLERGGCSGNLIVKEPAVTRTSVSLLGRLCLSTADPGAWSEFVRRYEPLIRDWCRRWKLQDADAQDVVQDVLTRLAARLRSFQYDPSRSFRGYLKTLAHYAWCDLLESRQRAGAAGSGDTAILEQLGKVEARDDLHARLSQAYDQELLEEASIRVRLRVEPRTWEAFRLTAMDGLSGAEASERLGMEVATVFKARSKVQKMLREETQKLEEAR